VTPLVGGTTVLLVGTMLIRLTLTDAYQRYVRVGMGPWLLLAGVLLALLGALSVVTALRHGQVDAEHNDHEGQNDHEGHDDHADHSDHVDGIGWLLLVPVLALLLVVPPALGSFGVDRSRVSSGSAGEFKALPASATPRAMTMLEFDQRAFDHGGASMRGTQLRLTGFVARPVDGAGFQLARYQIACCAADAIAAVARVTGGPGITPTREAWFSVTGTFGGLTSDGVPEFAASAVQPVPAPLDPYE
jgi:uncharacterized repeat protein (TIGR03943 family)